MRNFAKSCASGASKRAERDEEIDRNPIPLVAKPKQERAREPPPVAPYYVELIRQHMLDPTPATR